MAASTSKKTSRIDFSAGMNDYLNEINTASTIKNELQNNKIDDNKENMDVIISGNSEIDDIKKEYENVTEKETTSALTANSEPDNNVTSVPNYEIYNASINNEVLSNDKKEEQKEMLNIASEEKATEAPAKPFQMKAVVKGKKVHKLNFLVSDLALASIEKYTVEGCFRSKNDFVNELFENLDKFL